MKIQKHIEVWLVKKRLIRPVDLVQFDTGVQLVFTLRDFAAPSGTTATLYVQKPSGKFVYQETGLEVADNKVTIDLLNQALTEHGNNIGYQVKLKNGSDTITTFKGIFRVEESLADAGAEESATVIAAFEAKTAEQIAEIEAFAEEQIAQAKAEITAHGEAVNATIPSDYSELSAIAKKNEREKAPAIVCESSGEIVELADASDDYLHGLTIYGKTTQNGTPTPEAPIALENAGTAYEGIDVYVSKGKNIFGGDALADRLVVAAKATKDTEAGTVRYTAANVASKLVFNGFKPNTRYTVILYGRNTSDSNKSPNLGINYTDGSYQAVTFATAGEDSYLVYTTASGKSVRSIYGRNSAASAILYYNKCGVFEGVLTEADFVPYEGQTLSVSTPNGLPGVPVSSGGNYTDSNSQQWVCDEIDFAKGVYVQRIKQYVLNGSEKWYGYDSASRAFITKVAPLNTGLYNAVMCDKLPKATITSSNTEVGISASNSSARDAFCITVRIPEEYATITTVANFEEWITQNPLTVYTALTTPIETPLSAEELASFAALHTYKPNTTVCLTTTPSMERFWMDVAYVADTKTYIDNKFAQISAAILNA